MKPMKLISLLLLAAGCVGNIDPGTPMEPPIPDAPEGSALEMFVQDVQPLLRTCGNGTCHEATQDPVFLGATGALDDYDSVIGDNLANGYFNAVNARIIGKMTQAHAGLQPWTAAQVAVITAWLDAEAVERNITPGDPPVNNILNPFQAMERFAGCMNKTDWDNAQMGTWVTRNANGGGPCGSCHNNAGGLLVIKSNDSQGTFDAGRRQETIWGWFTPAEDPNLPGSYMVAPDYAAFSIWGTAATNSTHPEFASGQNNEYMIRLKNFTDTTMARFNNPADPCRTNPPGYLP